MLWVRTANWSALEARLKRSAHSTTKRHRRFSYRPPAARTIVSDAKPMGIFLPLCRNLKVLILYARYECLRDERALLSPKLTRKFKASTRACISDLKRPRGFLKKRSETMKRRGSIFLVED